MCDAKGSWYLAREGKVRSIYENAAEPENIVIVASDKVSAFDSVVPGADFPDKGKFLTQISAFWMMATRRIVPSALITIDSDQMGKRFGKPEFVGRSTKMEKLDMFPVECVVRGYITGSAWEAYKKGEREICGVELPDNLVESAQFPNPIFTPTTKAPEGRHDENLTFQQMGYHLIGWLIDRDGFDPARIHALSENYLGEKVRQAFSFAEALRTYSLELYDYCASYAKRHGLIIADTKFEFGLDGDGIVKLGDEVCTPDSSRYWDVTKYEPGRPQESFDKQLARDEFKRQKATGEVPHLTQDTIEKLVARYQEVYDRLVETAD